MNQTIPNPINILVAEAVPCSGEIKLGGSLESNAGGSASIHLKFKRQEQTP